jgi:hypothetical protein
MTVATQEKLTKATNHTKEAIEEPFFELYMHKYI